jgi:hypothetical protein
MENNKNNSENNSSIDFSGGSNKKDSVEFETSPLPDNDQAVNSSEDAEAETALQNKQKKTLMALVAGLLVLGGLGYYFWSKRLPPPPAPEIKIPLLGKILATPRSHLMNAQKIEGGRYLVNSTEFDQGRLSIVSADGQIARQYKFESPIPFVRPVAQDKFAVGTVLGDLYLVDAVSDSNTKILSFENGMISCLSQADGGNLIAGNLEGEVVYWNSREKKITAAWKTPDGTTPRICSPYGNQELLVVDAFSNIFAAPLFGKNQLKLIKSLTDEGSFENGKYAALPNYLAICQTGVLNIYNLPSAEKRLSLELDPEYLDFLISPEGKSVLVFTPNGLRVFEIAGGKEIFSRSVERLASVSYLSESAVLSVTEGGEPIEMSFLPQS